MHLTLTRLTRHKDYTIGALMHSDEWLCFTMENPWLDNQKIISCIPQGHYVCTLHNGSKYKDTWIVQDVLDRNGIVFHVGNVSDDTQGCILPGLNIGKLWDKAAVLKSRIAMDKLRDYINTNNDFTLAIKGL